MFLGNYIKRKNLYGCNLSFYHSVLNIKKNVYDSKLQLQFKDRLWSHSYYGIV